MSTIQHAEAPKLLNLIESGFAANKVPLTYKRAAEKLGRDPKKNSRMVAQVCNLLDAAAAFAGVPLLALVMVRESSGEINKNAWTANDIEASHREAIINRSLQHKFTSGDFKAIAAALNAMKDKGDKKAWHFVREIFPNDVLFGRIAELNTSSTFDAINDIGTDTPIRKATLGMSYARDTRIRDAVMERARGRCEFCNSLGFIGMDGKPYLESHHIIALSNEGADRMTNVIALCPNDHRAAHFGEQQAEIEKQMIQIVMLLEGIATRS